MFVLFSTLLYPFTCCLYCCFYVFIVESIFVLLILCLYCSFQVCTVDFMFVLVASSLYVMFVHSVARFLLLISCILLIECLYFTVYVVAL